MLCYRSSWAYLKHSLCVIQKGLCKHKIQSYLTPVRNLSQGKDPLTWLEYPPRNPHLWKKQRNNCLQLSRGLRKRHRISEWIRFSHRFLTLKPSTWASKELSLLRPAKISSKNASLKRLFKPRTTQSGTSRICRSQLQPWQLVTRPRSQGLAAWKTPRSPFPKGSSMASTIARSKEKNRSKVIIRSRSWRGMCHRTLPQL
jgi:hypothetical protein